MDDNARKAAETHNLAIEMYGDTFGHEVPKAAIDGQVPATPAKTKPVSKPVARVVTKAVKPTEDDDDDPDSEPDPETIAGHLGDIPDDDPEAEALRALEAGTQAELDAANDTEARQAAQSVIAAAKAALGKRGKPKATPAQEARKNVKKEVSTTNGDGSTNLDRFLGVEAIRVGTYFKPGNDQKLKAQLRKVGRGEIPLAEVSETALNFVNLENKKWYAEFGHITDPHRASPFYKSE